MKAHLIRTSEVAELLGVSRETCLRWCRRLGLELWQAPPRGMPTSKPDGTKPGRNAPAYLSIEAAIRLLDACMPGLAQRAARKRAQLCLAARARRARSEHVRVERTAMQG